MNENSTHTDTLRGFGIVHVVSRGSRARARLAAIATKLLPLTWYAVKCLLHDPQTRVEWYQMYGRASESAACFENKEPLLFPPAPISYHGVS